MLSYSNLSSNPLVVLEPRKEPRRYTLAAYLRREERAQRLHEYYDGIITRLPLRNGIHNLMATNIGTALHNALNKKGLNHIVSGFKQVVYLPSLNVGLYPDVLVIGETPQYFDDNEVLLINPLIIIEVLSKSTAKYDKNAKFEKYKTLDSFREYVLIDQNRAYIKTHYREEPNLWRDSFFMESTGKLYLKSVDCEIDMAAIYKNSTFKK